MDTLVSRIEAWGEDALDAADDAVAEAAVEVVNDARSRVRVDTGALRSSISRNKVSWARQRIVADQPYAARVESLESYFSVAFDDVQQDLRQRVASAIQGVR